MTKTQWDIAGCANASCPYYSDKIILTNAGGTNCGAGARQAEGQRRARNTGEAVGKVEVGAHAGGANCCTGTVETVGKSRAACASGSCVDKVGGVALGTRHIRVTSAAVEKHGSTEHAGAPCSRNKVGLIADVEARNAGRSARALDTARHRIVA